MCALWAECRAASGAAAAAGPFLFGRFTAADAFFAPVALRFRTYAPGDAQLLPPADAAYCAALVAMPEVQEWIAAADAETFRIAKYE